MAFMLQYLEKNYGEAALNGAEGELDRLTQEAARLKAQVDAQQKEEDDKRSEAGSEVETDEDVSDLP